MPTCRPYKPTYTVVSGNHADTETANQDTPDILGVIDCFWALEGVVRAVEYTNLESSRIVHLSKIGMCVTSYRMCGCVCKCDVTSACRD